MSAFGLKVKKPLRPNAIQQAQRPTSANHDCIGFLAFLFQVALDLSLETFVTIKAAEVPFKEKGRQRNEL